MLEKSLIYFDNAATTFKPNQVINSVIDYYSNSDFEYNIRVGDYCKVTLDSNLLYWISGIVVEIDEEENAFSIKDSNGSVTKISCDNICDIQSGEELQDCL